MAAAGFTPATSPVSDGVSPAGHDHVPPSELQARYAGRPQRSSRTRLAAYYATKYRLIAGFYDGRGWFRTSVLSRVKLEDRSEVEIGPGEAYIIEPGHDAWVVGDDTFVGYEFESRSADEYAKGP
jgi:hypothetical protein